MHTVGYEESQFVCAGAGVLVGGGLGVLVGGGGGVFVGGGLGVSVGIGAGVLVGAEGSAVAVGLAPVVAAGPGVVSSFPQATNSKRAAGSSSSAIRGIMLRSFPGS